MGRYRGISSFEEISWDILWCSILSFLDVEVLNERKSNCSRIQRERKKDRKTTRAQANSIGVMVARSFGYPHIIRGRLFTKGSITFVRGSRFNSLSKRRRKNLLSTIQEKTKNSPPHKETLTQ